MTAVWNSVFVGVVGRDDLPLPSAYRRHLPWIVTTFPERRCFARLVILPITLPGLITGVSMLTFFRSVGMDLSIMTVIIGHGTALTAIVVTNVFARLQRFDRRIEEASADLGARPWQTFRHVTLPNIRSAIIGSSLISFTLSFDEISGHVLPDRP